MTDDSTGPQANRGRPADNTATRARFSRDFGTRWASVAVRTSQVPFTRTELVDELTAASAALIDAITADPPRTEVGAAIGRQLVNLYLTGTEALGDSIRLLYTELLGGEGSPIADTARNRAAVTAVITPLTTGYIDALRESLFSDQELVKMAAFQARDNESIRRQESEARFRGVFDNAPIGIGIADKTGKILQVNQAMADMLGRSIADLTGRDSGKVVTDVVVPKDQQKILANFPQLVGGDIERYTAEVEMAATEDADPVWTNVSVTLVRDASGRPSFPMMLVENLSEQHLLGRALQQQVVTDELTKLATARRLESELRDLVLNAKPGRRIALCLFDIDGFRVINDGLGKQVGDVMLKRMADKLREYFPEPDNLVARLAGDGFAVLVRRPRTDAAVISAVDQLLEDVAEAHYPDPSSEVSAAICCSVGIVLDSTPGMQPDELQRAAEVTLHRAKMSGKAQWVVFDPESYQRDSDRLTLGALLPGALENGQIVIRYQPARQLAEKSVAAIRSVLQWEHPTLGVLDDQEFIGLAEETGLVVALGKELIERVCAHAAEWQRRLGEAAVPVSIKLPARLAMEQDLVRYVRKGLQDNDLDPAGVQIVLPADALADPNGQAVDAAEALLANGVGVSAWNLGGGSASMIDLHELRLSAVSVKESIVGAARSAEHGSVFERGLAELITHAHGVGVRVVAGNLRTADDIDRFARLGVDIGYGDALDRPMDAEQIEKLLADR